MAVDEVQELERRHVLGSDAMKGRPRSSRPRSGRPRSGRPRSGAVRHYLRC